MMSLKARIKATDKRQNSKNGFKTKTSSPVKKSDVDPVTQGGLGVNTNNW